MTDIGTLGDAYLLTPVAAGTSGVSVNDASVTEGDSGRGP